jgi:peptidoglycan biosynthesis protein MviN/MurJ (putative lipid II flippase)
VGVLLAAVGLAWGAMLLVLPDEAGRFVLGDSWAVTRTVLLATVVGMVGNLLRDGATYVVYARGATAAAFRINTVVAMLIIVLGLGGLRVGGVQGVAWGFAAAQWAVLPLWFRAVVKLGRRGVRPQPAIADSGEAQRPSP